MRNSTSMHPGLSVSHDSVFHPLNSGSSDLELDGAQSSSSLSISQPLGDAKLQVIPLYTVVSTSLEWLD